MKRQKFKSVYETVKMFKTKSDFGFNQKEIKELIKLYNIPLKTFNEALGVNTCMIENGQIITYHADIEKALNKTVNDIDQSPFLWD